MAVVTENARGCYCGLWQTSPDVLRAQGCAPGFCGKCDVCGAPGHTRHAPNAPYTAGFCDRCYERVANRLVIRVSIGATIAIAALMIWYFAR